MDTKQYIEETDLTLAQIAEQVGCTIKAVRKVWMTYPASYRKSRKAGCYRRSKLGACNPMTGKLGSAHHNYKGAVSDSKGYLMVLKPDWYTGRKRSKHVFLHSVVVCVNLGLTEIPEGYCVHHCDKNPHNNDFDNLVLLTLAEHSALHGSVLRGATTISKESTLKWVEARRAASAAKI